jgi:hypothetical protein
MFGIREQPVSGFKNIFFLKQKIATGPGYQKNHRRTGFMSRPISWHKQPRTSSFSGRLPDPLVFSNVLRTMAISQNLSISIFKKPWLWTLRITLITCRGLEQFLIPMQHYWSWVLIKGFCVVESPEMMALIKRGGAMPSPAFWEGPKLSVGFTYHEPR